MLTHEIEQFVGDLIEKGKSIDSIINELAAKECYHSAVRIVFLKKKILSLTEIDNKLESHKFFSKQMGIENPFTKQFIDSYKDESDPASPSVDQK